MATEDEKIAKLFNAGYQMQKHEPKLADKLISSKITEGDYHHAMVLGMQQALKDNLQQQQQQMRTKDKKRSR